MKSLAVTILAAGLGRRMRSRKAKVLHTLLGKPMIRFSVELAKRLNPAKIVVVVGYQAEEVMAEIGNDRINFVIQKEQLGTGHAMMCAEECLEDYSGPILILSADVPLLKEEVAKNLLKIHGEKKSLLTFITTSMDDPKGYGRVLRDSNGRVIKIVEDGDATSEQRHIREVNAGIYCVEKDFLFHSLKKLRRDNCQEEYYLTDIVKMAIDMGGEVSTYFVEDCCQVMGINDKVELAQAQIILQKQFLEDLMLQGVNIINPNFTYVDLGVSIGMDTVIYPNCYIKGKTSIGECCIIEPNCWIVDSKIGDFSVIKASSVIVESEVRDRAQVGPFAHLRPHSILEEGVKVGNFVEVKKSTLGKGTKAAHLAYIGDSLIGERANIGAGTITCNYDGKRKHQTIIEDGVFVGSDTQLVAPVKIGRGAYIGAGSTITKDVPSEALAIARARQVNLEGWAKRKKGGMEDDNKTT